MKSLIWILPVALLLCGCAAQAPEASQTQPSQGLYDPTHSVQTDTDGALEAYPLGDLEFQALAVMGDDYLLFGEDKLTLLSDAYLTPVTTVDAPGLPLPGNGQIQMNEKGVCYYSASERAVVFLGETLLEIGRLQLTEDITGAACLSPDWSKLYYCTPGCLNVLDMGKGTTKVLRTLNSDEHGVTGILMNGKVLRCYTKNPTGIMTYSLVSAETGATLHQGPEFQNIQSWGERYYFSYQMGPVTAHVFGKEEEAARCLYADEEQAVFPVLENDALVRLTRAEGAITMEYLELSTGRRTASVTLQNVGQVESVCGDKGCVWFQWDHTLYRWNPAQNPVEDETVYTMPYATRKEPDTAGLAKLEDTVSQIEQTWGVDILWQEEPSAFVPFEGYRFDTEYVPQVYERQLALLQQALEHFPKDFFQKAAGWTENPLGIVLVRGIYGEPDEGTLSSAPSVFYQLEGKVYLALSLWSDLERAFYHGVAHLIETPILSNCTAYYEWNTMNPEGFLYDNDYIANQNRQDEQYLQPGNQYFIDMYSMSFATEDRARILEYACLPGNEGYFASPVLQEKLTRIAGGIRKTFDLPEGSYLWEQYLIAQ